MALVPRLGKIISKLMISIVHQGQAPTTEFSAHTPFRPYPQTFFAQGTQLRPRTPSILADDPQSKPLDCWYLPPTAPTRALYRHHVPRTPLKRLLSPIQRLQSPTRSHLCSLHKHDPHTIPCASKFWVHLLSHSWGHHTSSYGRSILIHTRACYTREYKLPKVMAGDEILE